MSYHGICDSHAHLTSAEIYPQVDAIIDRAQKAGVSSILNICTDASCLKHGFEISQKHPWIAQAAAVHPHDTEKDGESFFPIVEKAAIDKKIVAIGETGLDYHYQHSTREIQQHYLQLHLQLALKCKLPVIIHCRDAYADFFKILDTNYVGPGVLHCFTGTLDEAQQGLERGFYVSFSGIVTFKKSEELRNVARHVPLEKLLIETDAPYLAPQSKRGKPNEPAYITETAEVMASVKGVSTAELIRITTQNAKGLFKLYASG